MSRKRIFDLVIAIAGVALIGVLAIARASLQQDRISVPSTYDTGANGLAALYEFLAREHVAVGRFESAPSQLFAKKGTLVVAGDEALLQLTLESGLRNGIEDWVKAGGTLVLLGARPSFGKTVFDLTRTEPMKASRAMTACGMRGKPYSVAGDFNEGMTLRCADARTRVALLRAGSRAVGIAYRHGKGTVVFVSSATPFDNLHLAQSGNARFSYALLAPAAPVAFDERMYGYANDKSMWNVLPQPVRYAIVIACAALLLAIAGANLPFAPPLDPDDRDVRDSSEYLTALASVLQRGRAHRDAVERFCNLVKRTLAPHRAQARARAMLEEARVLEMQLSLHDEEVLAAARLFARVRKDYPS